MDLILPLFLFIGLFWGLVKLVEWGDREIERPTVFETWAPSHFDGEGIIEMRKE
jgi:hypothetical protein